MITNESYRTVRYGQISSFRGAGIVVENRVPVLKIGHQPMGGADWLGKEGFVEIIPLDRGNEVTITLYCSQFGGDIGYSSRIRVGKKDFDSSPHRRQDSPQGAIDEAISPEARKLLFVTIEYLLPGASFNSPAPSWGEAVKALLANPVSAGRVSSYPWLQRVIAAVSAL